LGVLKFTTSANDIRIATSDEILGLFLNIKQDQIDQHAYVYGKFSHQSVEEHLSTCDFVTSPRSGFSAFDKGFANRIRKDIQRLRLGHSEMYTVSYFGETIRDPECAGKRKEEYPRTLEVFEVADYGVLAITPQKNKSQALVGESFVAGLFQSAADVSDFCFMGGVNAVHAGDRSYSLSIMNGYKLNNWLRDNYSENYADTPILKVEGLPQGLKDFVNEFHNQMADHLDVDPAKFEPTVHQVCIFWRHTIGSKMRDRKLGIFNPIRDWSEIRDLIDRKHPNWNIAEVAKKMQVERTLKKWSGTSICKSGRYTAVLKLNGKNTKITTFDLEVDAAYAWDQAMAARPPHDKKGNVMTVKNRNFQTEQDWLHARQAEISERRLKSVQSVESVQAGIKRKVEVLPA
jgi:hypothetical protein